MNNKNILRICIVALLFLLILCECQSYKNMPVSGNLKNIELNDAQEREYQYALTEATKQKVFGNIAQAAALYNKCIEVNPQSDVAYYQLGILYMRSGNNREAIQKTLKAIYINNQNFWYYIQLATLYQIVQNRDSAIVIYEKINEIWPGNNLIKFQLAVNYAEKGRNDEAIKILNKIEEENGISERVSLFKEQIYADEGNIEGAIKEISKLLESSPDEVKYIGILAELYGAAKMDQKAMECYNRIFELEPENGLAQLSIADYYRSNGDMKKYFDKLNEAFINDNIILEKKLEVMVTIVTDQKMMENNKDDIEILIKRLLSKYPDEYRTMTIYGDFLMKTNRHEEAVNQFEKVLMIDKTNYFVWEQLIFLYNNFQNYDKVNEKCLDALKLFPERPLLYMFKGNVESMRKEYDKSVMTFEAGLNLSGSNNELKVQFLSFLAEAYRNMGDNIKSDLNFQKALDLDPDNIILLNNFSYYLALREVRLKEAEKMSKRTITREPENSTYLDTYAWVLFKLSKYKKALEFIEIAVKHGGAEDPDILEHYGDILLKIGRNEEAVENWEKAIKYGGKEEELNSKIEKELH